MNKFYITTTIPYVNAAPHVGHALEFIQADVLARYFRSSGNEVYFLSGTDENAGKNIQAAEKEGISPRELVDRNSGIFRDLLAVLNISIDQFIRTTEERHFKGAQALWLATKKEDIYKKSYKGLYCVGCEAFYKLEELTGDHECPEHPGKKLEEIEEENYFFKLSNYRDWILDLIKSGKLKIVPETRKNEVLSLVERGLEDFSISRPVERSKNWGVPVPEDQSQTIYVWYDALANYITALGYPDQNDDLYKKFWLENNNKIHILGKGVSRFHAVYWPAMLKSAGLPIPNLEFVHGYITVNGQKISKTLGNVVDPFDLIKKYGAEVLRYYLLREISAYGDGDFSEDKLRDRYNSDLANGLGNFTARVLTLASQVKINVNETKVDADTERKIKETKEAISQKLNGFKFNEAIAAVWDLISFGDNYVNKRKPWRKDLEEEEKNKIIFNLVVILDNIAGFLKPFLPETAGKIAVCIKWEGDNLQIRKSDILFPRLE